MSKAIVAITPDGHEKLYTSMAELIRDCGGSQATIRRSLESGVLVKAGKLKGWRFERYNFTEEVLDTPAK